MLSHRGCLHGRTLHGRQPLSQAVVTSCGSIIGTKPPVQAMRGAISGRKPPGLSRTPACRAL